MKSQGIMSETLAMFVTLSERHLNANQIIPSTLCSTGDQSNKGYEL